MLTNYSGCPLCVQDIKQSPILPDGLCRIGMALLRHHEGTSLIMTVQELEQQLLGLPPTEKLRIIQILAQSLDALWSDKKQDSPARLSEFFRQSPLAEVVATGDLDLERDRSLSRDRFTP